MTTSDYPASSQPASDDPDAIRADIERTRAELSYNVDALADTANPKKIAERQVDKVKGAAISVKERIMGSDDPYDEGKIGDAKAAVSDRVRPSRAEFSKGWRAFRTRRPPSATPSPRPLAGPSRAREATRWPRV